MVFPPSIELYRANIAPRCVELGRFLQIRRKIEQLTFVCSHHQCSTADGTSVAKLVKLEPKAKVLAAGFNDGGAHLLDNTALSILALKH
jgi:hypothetical protein